VKRLADKVERKIRIINAKQERVELRKKIKQIQLSYASQNRCDISTEKGKHQLNETLFHHSSAVKEQIKEKEFVKRKTKKSLEMANQFKRRLNQEEASLEEQVLNLQKPEIKSLI